MPKTLPQPTPRTDRTAPSPSATLSRLLLYRFKGFKPHSPKDPPDRTGGFLQTALSELLRTNSSTQHTAPLRSTSDRVLTFTVRFGR